MKVAKVSIPIVKYRPLRRAEPGQVLAEDVFDREDNLVAEVGTELTEKHLRRFRNFSVRHIAVEDTLRRWIRSDRKETLPSQTEVLDTDTLRGGLKDVGGMILDASSPDELRQVIDRMKEKLETKKSDRVRAIESIRDKLTELDEDVAELNTRIENIDRNDVREELSAFLTDPGFHLAGTMLNLDAKETITRKTIEAGSRYEVLRNDLIELVRGLEDDAFLEVDARQPPADSSDEMPGEDFGEALETSMRHFRKGRLMSGLENLREAVAGSRDNRSDLEERLDDLLSGFEAESRKANELKDLMEDAGRGQLREMMADARDTFVMVPADTLNAVSDREDELRDRLSDFLELQTRNREELWSALDEYSGGEMAETIGQDDFFESVGRDQSPGEEEPAAADSPLGQKTREVLLLFRDNQPVRVLRVIRNQMSTEEIEDRVGRGNLSELQEEFEALQEDIAELEDRVRDEVRSPADRSALLTALDEPTDFDPETLRDVDASGALRESIESSLAEYNQRMETLRSYLDEFTGDQF